MITGICAERCSPKEPFTPHAQRECNRTKDFGCIAKVVGEGPIKIVGVLLSGEVLDEVHELVATADAAFPENVIHMPAYGGDRLTGLVCHVFDVLPEGQFCGYAELSGGEFELREGVDLRCAEAKTMFSFCNAHWLFASRVAWARCGARALRLAVSSSPNGRFGGLMPKK